MKQNNMHIHTPTHPHNSKSVRCVPIPFIYMMDHIKQDNRFKDDILCKHYTPAQSSTHTHIHSAAFTLSLVFHIQLRCILVSNILFTIYLLINLLMFFLSLSALDRLTVDDTHRNHTAKWFGYSECLGLTTTKNYHENGERCFCCCIPSTIYCR